MELENLNISKNSRPQPLGVSVETDSSSLHQRVLILILQNKKN